MYKTEAVIIKKQDLGEFDRLLTVYTAEFGKILVKAKSVRKKESKLKGHLELFLYGHLMLAPGKGFDIITGAETMDSFAYLRQSLESLSAAYYVCELTDKLIFAPERDQNIWRLVLSSFGQLNQKDAKIDTVVKNFENELLGFLGYGTTDNFVAFVEKLLDNQLHSYRLLKEFSGR